MKSTPSSPNNHSTQINHEAPRRGKTKQNKQQQQQNCFLDGGGDGGGEVGVGGGGGVTVLCVLILFRNDSSRLHCCRICLNKINQIAG